MAWTGQFTIWAKWAPPLERSKLTSIAGSGKDANMDHSFVIGFRLPHLSFYAWDDLGKMEKSTSKKFDNVRRLHNK